MLFTINRAVVRLWQEQSDLDGKMSSVNHDVTKEKRWQSEHCNGVSFDVTADIYSSTARRMPLRPSEHCPFGIASFPKSGTGN
ncbi:hypothetical protein J6590_010614 [Homalodisca vitripennis]|nr:hypothetical protein J6590_010614 [Homalodisca vitripennis]